MLQELTMLVGNLLIVLAGLSCIVSFPLTGKIDALYLLRPLGRGLRKGLSHLFQGTKKVLDDWRKALWRQVTTGRSSLLVKISLGFVCLVIGLLSMGVALPAELLKVGGKK